ncbi:MAG TPA: 2Fe-2S iron-sulfur cluster binding domain-containing protein [Polyangiaceae bacterium]|nr:2Fe-2S iron-sulfur cluster binding domain-containing protein [Polyangiaceae bacterium]
MLVVFKDVGLEVEATGGENLLELARRAGAPTGSHCGGVCACSKCHVYVTADPGVVTVMQDDERDMLDLAARELRDDSRLSCQTRVVGDGRCEVRISEESFRAYLDDHHEDRGRLVALWRRSR